MDESSSILVEEIETLEAIYIHELQVHRNESDVPDQIVLQLHPATGDDVDQQFVCMTLKLDLPENYPEDPPDISIKNPRGIGEEEVQSLIEDMHSLSLERRGGHMLYELIELAKDSLTAGNIPHCPCMICLEHFHEGDSFTKTECYHYFHHSCLARYIRHVMSTQPQLQEAYARHTTPKQTEQLICPVCREKIEDRSSELQETKESDDVQFIPSDELRHMQAEMAVLFKKQKEKGGIIDIEAERNKYLVKEDDVVLLAPAGDEEGDNETSGSNTKRESSGRGTRDKHFSRDNNHRYNRNNRDYRRPGSGAVSGDKRPGSRDDQGKDRNYEHRDSGYSRFTRGKGRGNRMNDRPYSQNDERNSQGRNREYRDKQSGQDRYRENRGSRGNRDNKDKPSERDDYIDKQSDRDKYRENRDKQSDRDDYRENRDKQSDRDKYRENRDKQSDRDKYRENRDKQSERDDYRENRDKQSDRDKYRENRDKQSDRDKYRDKQSDRDKFRENRDKQSDRDGYRENRGNRYNRENKSENHYRDRQSDRYAKDGKQMLRSEDDSSQIVKKNFERHIDNESTEKSRTSSPKESDMAKPVINGDNNGEDKFEVIIDKPRTETKSAGRSTNERSERIRPGATISDSGRRPDSRPQSGRHSDRRDDRHNWRNRGRNYNDKTTSSSSPRNKPEYVSSKPKDFQGSDSSSNKICDNNGETKPNVSHKGNTGISNVPARSVDGSSVEGGDEAETTETSLSARGNMYRRGRGRGRGRQRYTDSQNDKLGIHNTSKTTNVDNVAANLKDMSVRNSKSETRNSESSNDKAQATSSVSDKTKGPPGFRTGPPPGFGSDDTARQTSSIKPPPGF